MIKLPGDREESGGVGVNDMPAASGAEAPEMVDAALSDSRSHTVQEIRSALVTMRKSVGIYNGRLCALGDPVPLTNTPFASIPMAHM